MNQLLFERSLGNLGANAFARIQTTQLLNSFQAAPLFRFDGGERGASIGNDDGASGSSGTKEEIWAHQAGVNALALERFDGRILVSGGSDATIRLWDLEQCKSIVGGHIYKPTAQILRVNSQGASSSSKSQGHRFGITHLSFYPFDANAFLSSSYDKTLKLWATDSAQLSGNFDLGAKIYSHAASPIADHLLIACATQHPAVRLVDLRSGAAVQSLVSPGQTTGAVLSTAWSPRHEHVLATGAADGTVRIWDVRRGSGLIGLLDLEDGVGIAARGDNAVGRASAKAHAGPVNGLTWTDDGGYLVSAGHDRRIRVWDAATGANTLASFGPSVKNGGLSSVAMFTSPVGLTPPGTELLFWPNETEILVFDLHQGNVVTRLRGLGPAVAGTKGPRGGEKTTKNRVTSIVWRGAGGYGGSSGVVMGGRDTVGGVYSGHLDGQIRVWMPRVEGRDDEEEEIQTAESREQKSRKRKALDDAYKSLMGKQVTFS